MKTFNSYEVGSFNLFICKHIVKSIKRSIHVGVFAIIDDNSSRVYRNSENPKEIHLTSGKNRINLPQ